MQRKSSSYKIMAKRSGLLESEVYRRMDRVEHQVASDEPVVGEGSREERLDHILGGGVNARDDHQREHGERDGEDLQDHPDDLAELSLPAPAKKPSGADREGRVAPLPEHLEEHQGPHRRVGRGYAEIKAIGLTLK